MMTEFNYYALYSMLFFWGLWEVVSIYQKPCDTNLISPMEEGICELVWSETQAVLGKKGLEAVSGFSK